MNELLYSANAIPITPSNRLRLAFWNSDPDNAQTVLVLWRVQNKDGTISNNAEQIIVTAGAAGQEAIFPLPYGELLAVTLSTFNTVLQNGELYAVIIVQNGSVNDNRQQLPLISGYILANAPLSYPLGRVEAVNSGVPAMMFKTFNDPSTGGDLSITVSTTARSAIELGRFTFVADGQVANRTIQLVLTSNGTTFWKSVVKSTITAGLTQDIILTKTPKPVDVPADTQYLEIPIHPPIFNLGIATVVTGIQSGDQITNVTFGLTQYTAI